MSQDGLPGNPVTHGQHRIDFQAFWRTLSGAECDNAASRGRQTLPLQMNLVELQYSKFLSYKITSFPLVYYSSQTCLHN